MSSVGIHDRLIAAAARDVLGPLGFKRRGRSRLWFADHGWWLQIVEFQASGWSRGAYLNIAAKWLWYPSSQWSFDYSLYPGARVDGFREFVNEDQFADASRELAAVAGKETQRLRDALGTISVLADRLDDRAALGGWDLYHAGVAAFLAGRVGRSRECLARLSVPDPDDINRGDWLQALRASASDLAEASMHSALVLKWLTKAVHDSRTALMLPAWSGSLPRAAEDAV